MRLFQKTGFHRAGPAPGRMSARTGFTLPEFMIAMAIGLGVLAAAGSSYLFISKNGKALSSQIDFSDKARVLQSRFVEIVEKSHHLRIDDVQSGGLGPGIEIFYQDDEDPEYEHARWIGYVNGGTGPTSLIVYRPEGRDSLEGQQVLCTHVGPAYRVNGEEPPMFEIISGHSVLMNIHIGDSDAAGAVDDTGPGRQGMVVSIVGTSRNMWRKL